MAGVGATGVTWLSDPVPDSLTPGLPWPSDRCPLIPSRIHFCSEEGAVRRPRGGPRGRPWLGIPALPLAAWWAFTRLF